MVGIRVGDLLTVTIPLPVERHLGDINISDARRAQQLLGTGPVTLREVGLRRYANGSSVPAYVVFKHYPWEEAREGSGKGDGQLYWVPQCWCAPFIFLLIAESGESGESGEGERAGAGVEAC